MSKQLKITLAVLLMMAGFLLTRIGLYFKHSVDVASRVRGESTIGKEENNLLADSDNDGIADYDEASYQTDPFNPDTDGDGFLDGEEIVAGTDPIRSDKKVAGAQSSQSVTDVFIDRLLAGLYAGDLDPKSQNFDKDSKHLAFATLIDAQQTINPNLAQNAIFSQSDDSKDSQEKYLQDIAQLLDGPLLEVFMSQPQTMYVAAQRIAANDYKKSADIFNNLSMQFTQAYTRLLAIPVPPKWLGFHSRLLTIFKKISADHTALARIEADPLLALVALNDFAGTVPEVEFALLPELKSLVSKENLALPLSPLFDILGMLKKNPDG